jgi:hypothetical protein
VQGSGEVQVIGDDVGATPQCVQTVDDDLLSRLRALYQSNLVFVGANKARKAAAHVVPDGIAILTAPFGRPQPREIQVPLDSLLGERTERSPACPAEEGLAGEAWKQGTSRGRIPMST